MSTPHTWTIYALADPRTNKIRYVGVSAKPSERYGGHLRACAKKHTHSAYWIKSLLSLGLKPKQIVLEIVTNGQWQEAEKRHIKQQREAGANLTNLTDGGEGTWGREYTLETKAKIGSKSKGRYFSPATRSKMSVSHKGKTGQFHSPETKAKISAIKKGTTLSPEARAKISKSLKGKCFTAEHRAKISAARKGS
jgi:hypothetical protein